MLADGKTIVPNPGMEQLTEMTGISSSRPGLALAGVMFPFTFEVKGLPMPVNSALSVTTATDATVSSLDAFVATHAGPPPEMLDFQGTPVAYWADEVTMPAMDELPERHGQFFAFISPSTGKFVEVTSEALPPDAVVDFVKRLVEAR